MPAKRFVSDDAGSLTIFSLFLFIMLLFIAGTAVDMVHQEQRRVALQNTLDSAVLSAASMTQALDAETLVKDYVSKAGFDPNSVTVNATDTYAGNGTGFYSRQVDVGSFASTDTIFMGLLGVNSLYSPVGGMATESSENVEISLVLDISGSMDQSSADPTKTKLQVLKESAKEFIDVVFASNDPNKVSISIVPYNQQVYVPADMMAHLNVNNATNVVSPVPPYAGALTQYETADPNAPCFVFDSADFNTMSLSASNSYTRASTFLADEYYWALNGDVQQDYEQPYEWARWCGNYHAKVMPLSNNAAALKAHIDTFEAIGATAIDIGMNWGLALIDPSFRGVVDEMIIANDLSSTVSGRPFDHNATGVRKFVILMSDGANTEQFDLKQEYKSGPSRVWFSPSAGSSDENDGYFVLMPDRAEDERWYVPGSPNSTDDDKYLPAASLPGDALQLDYHDLHQRFGYKAIANFFFLNSDTAAYTAHTAASESVGGYGTADTQLDQLCTLARNSGSTKVFTIAFEAPTAGETALQKCAHAAGFYFDVDGTDLKSAFQSIAGQISLLRLKG